MKQKVIKQCDEYLSVHWYSTDEWKKVFMLIFGPESNDENKKEALDILLVWKSRNPYLPSAIESTLGLIEVDLQCPKDVNEICASDRLLRLMYTSVIMRFVNHTLDDAQSKRFTLLKAAKNLEIPRWIVDLRHEAAHGHDLPSLNMVRSATHKALQWLFNAYWEPQYKQLTNFVTGAYLYNLEENFSKLLNIHNLLAMCSYSPFKLKKISDISDKELGNDLIEDLKGFMDINHDMTIKKILLKILDIFQHHLMELTNVKIYEDMIAKIMVEPDSLFLTDIVNTKLKSNIILPADWFILWQPLLNVFNNHNLLPALINQLINLQLKDKESKSRKEKSAYWLKEIFSGLNKSNIAKLLVNYKNNIFRRDSQEILLPLLIDEHPHLKNGLVFNLVKPIPQEISNINFIEDVLKQYNPLSIVYAEELINLSQPKMGIENVQKILGLLRIINNQFGNTIITTENIYTPDDLKNGCSDMTVDEYLEVCETSDNTINNIWKQYSGKYNWEMCPIGMLPWQSGIGNPLY